MTINGRTNDDLTAIQHIDPNDPWFHFYWPYPGEVQGVSWWPYDDRNNPVLKSLNAGVYAAKPPTPVNVIVAAPAVQPTIPATASPTSGVLGVPPAVVNPGSANGPVIPVTATISTAAPAAVPPGGNTPAPGPVPGGFNLVAFFESPMGVLTIAVVIIIIALAR